MEIGVDVQLGILNAQDLLFFVANSKQSGHMLHKFLAKVFFPNPYPHPYSPSFNYFPFRLCLFMF
jgi:hypothetical protein